MPRFICHSHNFVFGTREAHSQCQRKEGKSEWRRDNLRQLKFRIGYEAEWRRIEMWNIKLTFGRRAWTAAATAHSWRSTIFWFQIEFIIIFIFLKNSIWRAVSFAWLIRCRLMCIRMLTECSVWHHFLCTVLDWDVVCIDRKRSLKMKLNSYH